MRRLAILAALLLAGSAQAANRYFISVGTNWNATANWSTNSGGTGGASVPGASDVAIFDANSTNCLVDAVVNVAGINLDAAYLGTFSQDAFAMTIGSSHFLQAGGTFVGASDAAKTFDANAAVGITGGTFTAPKTWYIGGTYFTNTAAVFDHNGSTLTLDGVNKVISCTPALSNVVFSATATRIYTIVGTLDVNGSFTITSAGLQDMNSGTITVAGDVVTADTSLSGTGIIRFDGAGNQTISASGATGCVVNVEIGKPSGTLTFQDTIKVSPNDGLAWKFYSGTVDFASSRILFGTGQNSRSYTFEPGTEIFNEVVFYGVASGTFTINPGYTFYCSKELNVYSMATINGSYILTNASLVLGDTAVVGTGLFTFTGSSNQTLSAFDSTGCISRIAIAKSGGVLTIADTIILTPTSTYEAWRYTGDGSDVDAGSSMVQFGSGTITTTNTSGNMHFNNVTINLGTSAGRLYTDTMFVDGDLLVTTAPTITGGAFDIGGNLIISWANTIDANFNVAGNLTGVDATVAGTGNTTLDGAANQTVTLGAANDLPNGTIFIDKSGGSAVLADNWTADDSGQDMVWTNGGINLDGYTLTLADDLTIYSGATTQTMSITDTTNGWISVGDQVVTNAVANGIADVDLLVDLSGATAASDDKQCWIIKAAANGLKGKEYNSVTVTPSDLWSGVVTYDQANGDAYIVVTYLGGVAAIPEFPQYRNAMGYDNQL